MIVRSTLAWKKFVHVVVNNSSTVPDNAFNLMTAELSGSPATVGSSYSFACLATKILSGLANVPSAEWVGPNGSAISQGDGLTLVPFTDTVSSEVIVQTAALHTSHAGLYTCRGSLSSPALTSPLVQETHFNITLQSMKSHCIYHTMSYTLSNTLSLSLLHGGILLQSVCILLQFLNQ